MANYGIILPGGTATEQIEQAALAERAGWDGVFVWEGGYAVDAWTLLAGMAMATTRVRLGTVLTPLPWRRPWKLAGQVMTLDQISGGRAILSVGLGAPETLRTNREITDRRERADRLDEGIDLIRALWAGTDVVYQGRHYDYQADEAALESVRPVREHIPIWVAAAWPRPKSMMRVLRCDGILPEYHLDGRDGTPDDVRELRAWLAERGARPDLDVIADGETPADDPAAAAARVRPWIDAGCTWWLETRWQPAPDGADLMSEVRHRITAGPPTP